MSGWFSDLLLVVTSPVLILNPVLKYATNHDNLIGEFQYTTNHVMIY